jgi:hypothetical protein
MNHSLKLIHSLPRSDIAFLPLLNAEAKALEEDYQKQGLIALYSFFLAGHEYRFWTKQIPESLDERLMVFRKWIMQVVEADLGIVKLELPPEKSCSIWPALAVESTDKSSSTSFSGYDHCCAGACCGH